MREECSLDTLFSLISIHGCPAVHPYALVAEHGCPSERHDVKQLFDKINQFDLLPSFVTILIHENRQEIVP